MLENLTLTAKEFDEIVLEGEVCVIDVSATWCGPCVMMKPTFEKFAEQHNDYRVISIDSDECPEVCQKLAIMYLPTFLVFRDGQELARQSGYMSEDDFQVFINDALKTE